MDSPQHHLQGALDNPTGVPRLVSTPWGWRTPYLREITFMSQRQQRKTTSLPNLHPLTDELLQRGATGILSVVLKRCLWSS
jgi:hypothetical protein